MDRGAIWTGARSSTWQRSGASKKTRGTGARRDLLTWPCCVYPRWVNDWIGSSSALSLRMEKAASFVPCAALGRARRGKRNKAARSLKVQHTDRARAAAA